MSAEVPGPSSVVTLGELERQVRAAWGRDTCDPVDLPAWHPGNPARGQCGVTSLLLHDLLGGGLVLAEVRFADGRRQGVHYWNRLAGGLDIDLTREQFTDGEVIGTPHRAPRPDAPPTRCREQYELLRRRVLTALGGP